MLLIKTTVGRYEATRGYSAPYCCRGMPESASVGPGRVSLTGETVVGAQPTHRWIHEESLGWLERAQVTESAFQRPVTA